MSRGDLPLVARWLSSPARGEVVAQRGGDDPRSRHRALRPGHRRDDPDPALGGGDQRPVDGLRAGLPGRATTPSSRCWRRIPTRSGRLRHRRAGVARARVRHPAVVGLDGEVRAPPSRRHGLLRRPDHANAATCGCSTSWVHPGPGSTNRRVGTIDTFVGCTLDVRRVLARQHHAVRHDVLMTDDIAAHLRLPAGPVDLTAIETEPPPASTAGRATARPRSPSWAPSSPTCRSGPRPSAPSGRSAASCWCCRAWTPAARAAYPPHGRRCRPAGRQDLHAFKAPTDEEKRARLPLAGARTPAP